MGTINDKLTYLNGTKTAIKDAIVAKGGTVSENDTFRSYANKISNLPSGQPNLQDKTVSPTTSQQTVIADAGYDGLDEVTVNGVTSAIDNNIQAGNIKKNTTILGVTGTYEGIDTSDANATSEDIRAGKTAYVNGSKRTGAVPEHKYSGLLQKYTDAEQFTPGTIFSSGRYIAVASAVTSGYVGSNFIVNDNKLRVGVPNSMLQSAGGITADKIKVGESIYGVTGTFTNDANATASDIAKNKTAYVNGTKVTGTLEVTNPRQDLYYYASSNARDNDTDFHMVGDISFIPQQTINTDKIVNLYQQYLFSIYVPSLIEYEDINDFIQEYNLQPGLNMDFQTGAFYPDSQYPLNWSMNISYPDIMSCYAGSPIYCMKMDFIESTRYKTYQYVFYYLDNETTGLELIWAGVLQNYSFNEGDAIYDGWETYYQQISQYIVYEIEGDNWINLPSYCQATWNPSESVNSFYHFCNGKAGRYASLMQYSGGWIN